MTRTSQPGSWKPSAQIFTMCGRCPAAATASMNTRSSAACSSISGLSRKIRSNSRSTCADGGSSSVATMCREVPGRSSALAATRTIAVASARASASASISGYPTRPVAPVTRITSAPPQLSGHATTRLRDVTEPPRRDERRQDAEQARQSRPALLSTNILVSIILGRMANRSMTGQAFFVLTALADAPRHGYGIVREVAELSQGRVKLKIGSLYGVLDRLSADGLIEPDREEAHDGRLRRYYRLTAGGRRALAEEADLRAATAHVVRARLGLTGPEAAGAAGGAATWIWSSGTGGCCGCCPATTGTSGKRTWSPPSWMAG